jgi:hypothetical protein
MTDLTEKWKLKFATMYLLMGESQTAIVVLPKGYRMLCLMRGQQPFMAPIDEAGTYEVDALTLAHSKVAWPMAVMVVEQDGVNAWLKLPGTNVSSLLDECMLAGKEQQTEQSRALH